MISLPKSSRTLFFLDSPFGSRPLPRPEPPTGLYQGWSGWGSGQVSEAAVVGYPHDIKGQGIYCYVTLMSGETPSDELKLELRDWVRKEIGPIASPDLIQFAPGLPKTRSGKIMRRILRKIAEDDFSKICRDLFQNLQRTLFYR